jgi:multiple sugar transport system permease protein
MRLDFSLGLARPSRQHWLGYILLLPALALVALMLVYPLLVSADLSFQNVGITRIGAGRRPFTFDNYARLVSSDEFWATCWVTFRLLVIVTTGCAAIGLGTALLLNNSFKGRAIARLVVALPWAVPDVVAVVIFAWIFDSSFGVVNWTLVKLGIIGQTINWFSDPTAAFAVVCVTMIWKGYPFVSIMTLAGLQGIPDDFYQAALVDGATAWQRFVNVTLPSVMPVFGITLVFVVLWVFRDFSIIYVLTGGGPVKATQTLSIMTYEQAFKFFHMGYASAVGMVTLVLCVLASRLMIDRRVGALY